MHENNIHLNTTGVEIERKYLIVCPDLSWLERQPGLRKIEIVQTYLLRQAQSSHRVRQWKENGESLYIETRKSGCGIRRTETERQLTEAEYHAALEHADPDRRPIVKTRYILPFDGQNFEIDIYPFWTRQAVMEIELESEDQPIRFPAGIRILREVTGDPNYTNSALALHPVGEDADAAKENRNET